MSPWARGRAQNSSAARRDDVHHTLSLSARVSNFLAGQVALSTRAAGWSSSSSKETGVVVGKAGGGVAEKGGVIFIFKIVVKYSSTQAILLLLKI